MNERDWVRKLTRRQRQVAALVARGLSNRSIAERLGISPNTVRRHVSDIMLKLNVYSRAQIAFIVAREGWSLDEPP